MMGMTEVAIKQHVDHWNRVVGTKQKLVGETATHMLFLHPTKGKRSISKKRLRLA